MRIIGGSLGGRRFNPPAKTWPTRPTTDQAKESLYNILSHKLDFEAMVMLDLFGGTGSHCYECVSRGCRNATYVDSFTPAVRYVRDVVKQLGIEDQVKIVSSDALKFLHQCTQKYSFVFADPPYNWSKGDVFPDLVLESGILDINGIFVFEHSKNISFTTHKRLADTRIYGATVFSFFE
jgi:16S rRNA (guanine(966)-N(2))-methyltransferase RsmD